MKIKAFTILLAVTVLVVALCWAPVSAANPILPSNETSKLAVEISAYSSGLVLSKSDLTYTQGNGNLVSIPPCEQGEGISSLAYAEKTVATSGTTGYVKTIYLDTSSKSQPQNNLETFRSIDYSSSGDGNGLGVMYSKEEVMIDTSASTSDGGAAGQSCCGWGTTTDDILPASCVSYLTGSTVYLREGQVNSDGSVRMVSSDIDEGVQLSYSVDVEGSGQTGNQTAIGKATVYVDAIIMEGSGNQSNLSSVVKYDEKVTVDGLVQIALSTGYSSP